MSYPPPSVPSDSSPPTGERPKIKPGKGWYWVGGLLVVGGLLGGAALGAAGVVNMVNSIEDFGRFKVEGGAGAATVTFEKPGEYSIYYESESKVCGDLGATADQPCEKVAVQGEEDPPAQLDISITSGERSLPIGPADNRWPWPVASDSVEYSSSGYSGTEVATVDVDEAGAYSMVVETRREGEFAIALGKDVVSTILPWILGAMALAAVGLILGLIILIVTGVKRSRRKREASMAAATAYPSAPAVFTPAAAPPAPPPAPVAVPPVVPAPVGAPPPPPVGEPPGPMPAPPPPDREPVPVGKGAPTRDDSAFAPPSGQDAWGAPTAEPAPPPAGTAPVPPPPPPPDRPVEPGSTDDDAAAADDGGWDHPTPADAAAGPHLPPPPPSTPPQAPPGQGGPPAPPLPSPSEPSSGTSLPPPPPPPPS